MVIALIAKELLDVIPVWVVVAGILVVIGLESAGVSVIDPAADVVIGIGESVWNWIIDALRAELGL